MEGNPQGSSLISDAGQVGGIYGNHLHDAHPLFDIWDIPNTYVFNVEKGDKNLQKGGLYAYLPQNDARRGLR